MRLSKEGLITWGTVRAREAEVGDLGPKLGRAAFTPGAASAVDDSRLDAQLCRGRFRGNAGGGVTSARSGLAKPTSVTGEKGQAFPLTAGRRGGSGERV